ncbi:hypothetical protein [Demequina zhanjiangensis]|uniref:Phosphotyrosine protein phosphatase I domain-containing protein n=1 Tax=Demequina zhanjiangensis TaxID=3051659 RepID=A0ABT8FYP8_9MICO|nr:hypothetical protein [Demequina sp. SYSU T00b26]MDN4472033.1 hypothetical protein [Demequina sp. SYSU T00b26]
MTSILTVCTGNICRSPAAAIALQGYLGDIAQLSSAGVAALVDEGLPIAMSLALEEHGLDGRGHHARMLTPRIVDDSDLIIAMTAEHRRRIVSESPRALKRSFLYMELVAAARAGAPLPGDTPAERVANIAPAIQAYRPYLAGQDIPDVPDPYRRPQEVYDEVATMIVAGAGDIAAWVRPEDDGR